MVMGCWGLAHIGPLVALVDEVPVGQAAVGGGAGARVDGVGAVFDGAGDDSGGVCE